MRDSLLGFLLHERVCKTFCGAQKKATDGLCHYKSEKIFKFPASLKNLVESMGVWAEDWMPQWYRRTLGDSTGSEMSLSILEFWKWLSIHFMFTSVILYFSEIFAAVEKYIFIVVVFLSYGRRKSRWK